MPGRSIRLRMATRSGPLPGERGSGLSAEGEAERAFASQREAALIRRRPLIQVQVEPLRHVARTIL